VCGCSDSCEGREIRGGGVLRGAAPTGAEETDRMLPQRSQYHPGA
jgi:hypothetical protein